MIITAKNYDWAMKKVDELWDSPPETEEAMLLDLLFTAIQEYERAAFPHPVTDAVDAILFRMDQMGWRQKDVAHLFGGPSHASEVLNRRRRLSKEMAVRVHGFMGIPLEDLLDEKKTDTSFVSRDEDFRNDNQCGRKTGVDTVTDFTLAA